MMLAGLSMLAAAAVAATPSSDLPRTFVQACLDGQVDLGSVGNQTVPFSALPYRLQDSLGSPSSARVLELGSGGSSYLYVLEYAPVANNPRRTCGLAAKRLDRSAAADAISRRIDGVSLDHRDAASIGFWHRQRDGYVALVTRLAGFTVLQVTWLTDEQQKRAIRELKTIGGMQ